MIVPLLIRDAKLAAWLVNGRIMASPAPNTILVVGTGSCVIYWKIDPDARRSK